MRNSIERHPLGSFFLLAYGWSWLFWVPAALISQGTDAPTGIEG